MDIVERVKREKDSYDSGDVWRASDELHTRFHHVFKCPNTLRAERYYIATIEKYAAGKDLLDYGCYTGSMVQQYAGFGTRSITGIDISEAGIQQAIKDYGHLAKFYVGDAHKMPFPDNSFDVIVGRAILHHLDFETALHEISRTLRPAGHAIFVEPLGDNPAAKLFQRLTPRARTKDEAPLSRKQIQIGDKLFGSGEHWFNNLASTPVPMATSLTRMNSDNFLLRAMDGVDMVLSKSPMKYWMRQVVLVWQKL
jgi:SAM-dependent methyltransferase